MGKLVLLRPNDNKNKAVSQARQIMELIDRGKSLKEIHEIIGYKKRTLEEVAHAIMEELESVTHFSSEELFLIISQQFTGYSPIE